MLFLCCPKNINGPRDPEVHAKSQNLLGIFRVSQYFLSVKSSFALLRFGLSSLTLLRVSQNNLEFHTLQILQKVLVWSLPLSMVQGRLKIWKEH